METDPAADTGPHRRVEFQIRGARSATAPLTWSQASLLGSMRATDKAFNVGRLVSLDDLSDDVATEADVLSAIALVTERHETLRTSFRFTGTGGVQQVAESGQQIVEVREAAGSAPEEVAATVLRADVAVPFALDRGSLVRFCLVLRGGRPAFLVIVAAHIAVDWQGLDVLVGDFRAALDGPAALAARPAPAHPVERAAYEAGEAGAAASARALGYWRQQLFSTPQSVFAVPAGPAAQPRWQHGCLDTSAGAAAVARMLERGLRTTPPALIVAAFAAVAAHYGHARRFSCLNVVANRRSRELQGYVGTLAQNVMVSFDVDPEADTFQALANKAFRATLQGIMNGAFDRDAQDRIGNEAGTLRGLDLRFGYYNFISDPTCRSDIEWNMRTAALEEMRQHSRFRWLGGVEQETIAFYLAVRHSESMLQLSLLGDTVVLPADVIPRVLTGVEALLVEAATDDFPLTDVARLTGIDSVPLPVDTYRIDGSLASLEQVRRALESVPGVRRAGVFVTAGTDGSQSIVAYLTPERDPIDPDQVHVAVLAALPDRMMVIAPHHYVVCADAPGSSEAGIELWKRQRVVARGSGRN